MKRKIIELLKSPKEIDIDKIMNNCKCADEVYNNSLYGVRFPCCHKILEQIYKSEELVHFQKNNQINIKGFIIHFLEMFTIIMRLFPKLTKVKYLLSYPNLGN